MAVVLCCGLAAQVLGGPLAGVPFVGPGQRSGLLGAPRTLGGAATEVGHGTSSSDGSQRRVGARPIDPVGQKGRGIGPSWNHNSTIVGFLCGCGARHATIWSWDLDHPWCGTSGHHPQFLATQKLHELEGHRWMPWFDASQRRQQNRRHHLWGACGECSISAETLERWRKTSMVGTAVGRPFSLSPYLPRIHPLQPERWRWRSDRVWGDFAPFGLWPERFRRRHPVGAGFHPCLHPIRGHPWAVAWGAGGAHACAFILKWTQWSKCIWRRANMFAKTIQYMDLYWGKLFFFCWPFMSKGRQSIQSKHST